MLNGEQAQAIRVTSFTTEHVVIPSWRSFEEVIVALESRLGVPADWEILPQQLAARKLSWEEVADLTMPIIGTSGFTTFIKMDQGAVLSLTGKIKHIAQYSIGNHLLGVQMIEIIPEIGLYAPPRLLVYDDYEGTTFITYDRLSSLVGQYQNEEVSSIARFVDQKLEELARGATGNEVETH